MRLKRIELENFRGHRHLELDFTDPRTLLVGENGAGKSSVRDAITWGLIGRCPGVDGKGQGQKDLIRTGADGMVVSLDVEPLGKITRSVTRTGSALGTMKPDMVLGRLGVSEAMLMAAIYGGTFFDMHHANAKALLLQLLEVRIDPKDLPGLDAQAPLTLDDLEAEYQRLFQERTLAKRQLAAHLIPPDPPPLPTLQPGEVGYGWQGMDLQQLKDRLKDAQGLLERAARAQGDADAQADTLARQIRQAEQALAGLDKLKGTLEAHQGMLAEHQRLKDEATTDLQAAEQAIQDSGFAPVLESQVAELRLLLDKIERHRTKPGGPGKKKGKHLLADEPHTCVLGAGIPCLTPPSQFLTAAEDLKAQVAGLDTRIKAANDQARKLGAAQSKLKEAERNITYHQGQIDAATRKIQDTEQHGQQLDQWKADLKDAQDEAVEWGRNVDQERPVVASLIDRIQAVQQHAVATKAHQAAVAAQAQLKADVTRLEDLVELTGPTGVRVRALSDAVGDFEAAINAALDPFGFALGINADPWRIEVRTPDTGGQFLVFDQLSQGQKLWTALAFQAALAALSGLDFFAVDDVEKVVGRNLQLVTQVILGLPVGQIIVAMAKADSDPVPEIEGLQVVRLGEAVPA